MTKKAKHPMDSLMYRQNFYLWIFISQEGLWSEAKEFLEENMDTPIPFESEIKNTFKHKTKGASAPWVGELHL